MLKVQDLKTVFKKGSKELVAVDGISFEVPKNKIVGLVGESGSGKSITLCSILNLLPKNGRIENGSILWNDIDLTGLPEAQLRKIRGSEIALIFQNPLAALNPVYTIGNQLIETIRLHQKVSVEDARHIGINFLRRVHIPEPEERMNDYPHQFSMGMCQRAMIAITLAMKPKLLMADEPTASLDVTIQAQIIGLLKELQTELSMSILLVSHDLGVIAQSCDEICIMYLGSIVEKGTPKDIFGNPLHPYTQALIHAIPSPNPEEKQVMQVVKGEMPSPLNLPQGCRFHTRCPHVMEKCKTHNPPLVERSNRLTACYLYEADS